MIWANFINEVLARLSDTAPTNATFTEAQAAYVRARMALELDRDKDAYAIHQNRYTALRRRLVGYSTTLNAGAQVTAVRALVADITAGNTQFALACSYWIKAHQVNDLDRDAAGGWMARFMEQRRRLLGYTPTFADLAALKAAVTPYLSLDAPGSGQNAWYEAQLAAADSELRGLLSWFTAQVAAAAADLVSLRARVMKEIRTAAIVLQEYVPAYVVGHRTTVTFNDVMEEGAASAGTLPDGAALREAWMLYRENVWDATATYEAADEVWFPGVPSAIVSGAGTAEANGEYLATASNWTNGQAAFLKGTAYIFLEAGDTWTIGNNGEALDYYNSIDVDTGGMPWGRTYSFISLSGTAPAPTVTEGTTIRGAGYYRATAATTASESPYSAVSKWVAISEVKADPRVPAVRVGWDDRYPVLIYRTDSDPAPAYAVARNGRDYLVIPALIEDETELELVWDGKKLDFKDTDETPFDEAAAGAAALRVQSELASEFGLSVAEARDFERRFNDRMGECYVETNQRARGRF